MSGQIKMLNVKFRVHARYVVAQEEGMLVARVNES
jgi:hypothetical protein